MGLTNQKAPGFGVSRWYLLALVSFLVGAPTGRAQDAVVIGAIGDYGTGGDLGEGQVARLVKGWNPDFIITLGDNNLQSPARIDPAIGQFYHDYIYPYTGGYGAGAVLNRFFPCLGNHDVDSDGGQAYFDYFALPGNERYYNYRVGPVEMFALNCVNEPDGVTNGSVQAQWLQAGLAASTAAWKLVYFHYPPFSSGNKAREELRWPFRDWGAAAVLSGDDHVYERIVTNDMVYFVNGLGGVSIYPFYDPIPGSEVRFNGDYGALRIDVTESNVVFNFVTRSNALVDTYCIGARHWLPRILAGPQSATVVAGRDVGFQVLAASPDAVTIQWRYNGNELSGATNVALTLTGVRPEQGGDYTVMVSNSSGTFESQAARLTVLGLPPSILTQPTNVSLFSGNTASFRVVADGGWPLFYQWRWNGVGIEGATNSSLALAGVNSSQNGSYSVLVSNAFGSVTSDDARLTTVTLSGWRYGGAPPPLLVVDAVAIAAGDDHFLALQRDGTVMAWGADYSGQTDVPPDLSNVVAVAAGRAHSLALKRDHTLIGWGDNSLGQIAVPSDLTNVVAVAAGSVHSLALRADGTVAAWGANNCGQTNVPLGLRGVVAVAAGLCHSLVLKADGSVLAWGAFADTNVPPGTSNIVAIAANGQCSFALSESRTIIGWGSTYSQLKPPAGLSNIVDLAVGSVDGMALKSDGAVSIWTTAGYWQPFVPPNLTNVVAIAASGYQAMVLAGEGPPTLITPLLSQVALGQTRVQYHARATGARPVSYQWRRNGTNLLDATNSDLTLPAVQLDDAGAYSVLASNRLGTSTSLEALLTVVPGVINISSRNQIRWQGEGVTLSATVQTNLPANYQWLFNGTPLPGATNASLTLADLALDQAGSYSLSASNAFGVVESRALTLQVRQVALWGFSGYGLTNPPSGLTNLIAVAAGGARTLALKADGTAVGWGDDSHCERTPPPGLSNLVAVAAGGTHSLALQANGMVVGWGANDKGQTAIPDGLTNAVAISAGYSHSLASRADGTVVAWGEDLHGQTEVPPGLWNVVAIAAGYYHNLALTADGAVVGWGDDDQGQASIPSDLSNVVAIAAGGFHSLALKSDGTVRAWGDNANNEGNVPAGLSNVCAIASGRAHNMAMRNDGSVVAWGAPGYGRTIVPPGLTRAVGIAAGDAHSVALFGDGSPTIVSPWLGRCAALGTEARLRVHAAGSWPLSYQWRCNGTNLPEATNATLVLRDARWDQAGVYSVTLSNAAGILTSSNLPLTVEPTLVSVEIARPVTWEGGGATLEAVIKPGWPADYQWRLNGTDLSDATNATLTLSNLGPGQAGPYTVTATTFDGSATSREVSLSVGSVAAWGDPAPAALIPGLTNLLTVAAGTSHSLALRADGTVRAWGDNCCGQRDLPPGLSNVVAIAAGAYHNLALRTDGSVLAWGDNRHGQTDVPPGLSNVVAITARAYSSLALGTDGLLIGWGDGQFGQFNPPPGLPKVAAISLGASHTLALLAGGSVACWGFDPFGVLTDVPVDLTNVIAIVAGEYHNVALTADGRVKAWGESGFGEIDVPLNLSNVVGIAAGYEFTMALQADGTVVAWGRNALGQADVPAGLSKVVSIACGVQHSLALIDPGVNPRILELITNSQSLSVSLWTFLRKDYSLEATGSLGDPDWRPVVEVGGRGAWTTITDTNAPVTQRFYRVRVR